MSWRTYLARIVAVLTLVAAALMAKSIAQQEADQPRPRCPSDKESARSAPTDAAAEATILKQLAEATEYAFAETPLKQVLEYFRKKHSIPIVINQTALVIAGTSDETALTGTAKGISLEAALNRLLGEHDLSWVIRHQALDVTSREDAQTFYVTRVYGVADLVVPAVQPEGLEGPPEPDYDSLIDLITNVVDNDSWRAAGGPGSIEPAALTLVVSQNQATHRKIEAFLSALRGAAKAADPARIPATKTIRCPDDPAEERIAAALRRNVSIALEGVLLTDLVKSWSKDYGLEIAIDQRALGEASVDAAKAKVKLRASDVSLRSALELVLRQHGLSWIIQNGVLRITSPDKAGATLSVRVYPVADLITSDGDTVVSPSGRIAKATTDEELLIDAIVNTIAPDQWRDAGGPGGLEFFLPSAALVCLQTRDAHERIEQLLADIREHGTAPKRGPRSAKRNVPQPPDDDQIMLRTYALPLESAARTKVGEETAKLIQEIVAPESWKAKDTPAFVRIWPDRLVVRQTVKAHAEIRQLLQDLDLLVPPDLPTPPAPPPRDD